MAGEPLVLRAMTAWEFGRAEAQVHGVAALGVLLDLEEIGRFRLELALRARDVEVRAGGEEEVRQLAETSRLAAALEQYVRAVKPC